MNEEDENSDIEDLSLIRGEQDYFKRLCFFHQVKISNLTTANVVAGKGLEHYQIYAIYLEILDFETDLEGLFDDKYWEARNKIVDELKGIESKTQRKDYLESLMKWKRLLISRLAKRTDYLPSLKVNLWIGNQRIIEEDDPIKARQLISDSYEGEPEEEEPPEEEGLITEEEKEKAREYIERESKIVRHDFEKDKEQSNQKE